MSYELTRQQEMFRKATADFGKRVLDPISFDIDRTAEYPEAAINELAKTGMFGLLIPAENGGTGADMLSYVICVEEVGKYCASVAEVIIAHSSMAAFPMVKYGKSAAKNYLPAMAEGEILGGYAVGEVGAAIASGSDKLVAIKDGDNYVLNGKKYFVFNGGVAGVYVVIAQTNEAAGQKGLSAFVVDAKAEGLTVARKIDKLGLRSLPTAELHFNNVKVPVANLLGAEEQGAEIMNDILQHVNIANAGVAAGIGQISLDESMSQSKRRVQFGAPIAKLQAIQVMLCEMASGIHMIRLGAYNAAKTFDSKGDYITEASLLKQYAAKACWEVTWNAIQIHGGTGYSREAKIERYHRDMVGMFKNENMSDYAFKTIFPAISK